MAKLLPPYIDGSLPAQYDNVDNVLSIPFRLNRAVSIHHVQKMYAKIKTIATDRQLAVLESTGFNEKADIPGVYLATFPLGDLELVIGQNYKIQLAFGNEVQGYFSTIGIFKYTCKAYTYIEGLDDGAEIGNQYTYVGVYDQTDGDPTERL